MTLALRDQAAIAGIGLTEFSKDSGVSELELAARCVTAAWPSKPGTRRSAMGHALLSSRSIVSTPSTWVLGIQKLFAISSVPPSSKG